MLLTILLLVLVAVMIYLVISSSASTATGTRSLTRTVDPAAPSNRYRIWTAGNEKGVAGRYYMAAYGVTQDTANKVVKTAAASDPNSTFSSQQLLVAASTIALGAIVFYFRADGDVRPFNGPVYLKPIGDIANITSDDVFTLTQTATQTLIQVPAIDNDQVSACNDSQLCQDGILGFGGIVTGSTLQLQTGPNGGVYITRQVATGLQGLKTGNFLCPYKPDDGKTGSPTLIQACNVIGAGGPRIPVMAAGQGDLYYLEQVV